jgi:hypothetical protein
MRSAWGLVTSQSTLVQALSWRGHPLTRKTLTRSPDVLASSAPQIVRVVSLIRAFESALAGLGLYQATVFQRQYSIHAFSDGMVVGDNDEACLQLAI